MRGRGRGGQIIEMRTPKGTERIEILKILY
jgi:hypothetical protein